MSSIALCYVFIPKSQDYVTKQIGLFLPSFVPVCSNVAYIVVMYLENSKFLGFLWWRRERLLAILMHIPSFLDEKTGSTKNSKSDSTLKEVIFNTEKRYLCAKGKFSYQPFRFLAMTNLVNVLYLLCDLLHDSVYIYIFVVDHFITFCCVCDLWLTPPMSLDQIVVIYIRCQGDTVGKKAYSCH